VSQFFIPDISLRRQFGKLEVAQLSISSYDHPKPAMQLSFFCSILWSVAVSTICRHLSRVVAFLQAVARPKLRGPRPASIAQTQVWLGLPIGRFQSGGLVG